MGTINATIRDRGIAGKEYPIVIRVIHNRASAEVKVDNFRVEWNQWDFTNQRVNPKYHRRANVINSAISTAKRSMEDAHDVLALSGKVFTVKDIVDRATNKKGQNDGTFYQYLEEYIQTNPDELRYGTLKHYKSTLLRWKQFLPEIMLSELDENHLVAFRKYLLNEGNHINTVYNRMKTIRKLMRRAMQQGLIDKNPFLHITLKQIKGNREHLTLDEISRLVDYHTDNINSILAKDIFLFSCHTGLRFSDICRLSRENLVPNGTTKRLNLRMGKTSEVISFNLSQMANDIVDKYIFEDEDLIFPLLRDYRGKTTESAIGSKNAMLNAYLKEVIAGCGIEKDISMHCARHSFAVNSLAMGADIYVLSKFLGHTSLATTEIYAKAVDKRKDELTKLWD